MLPSSLAWILPFWKGTPWALFVRCLGGLLWLDSENEDTLQKFSELQFFMIHQNMCCRCIYPLYLYMFPTRKWSIWSLDIVFFFVLSQLSMILFDQLSGVLALSHHCYHPCAEGGWLSESVGCAGAPNVVKRLRRVVVTESQSMNETKQLVQHEMNKLHKKILAHPKNHIPRSQEKWSIYTLMECSLDESLKRYWYTWPFRRNLYCK